MKKLFIIFFILSVIAFLGCTSTNQSTNLNKMSLKEIKAYNDDPKNIDKIVCSTENPIGSHIPKRVCRKESLIEARSRMDQQDLENLLNRQKPAAVQGGK